VRKYRTETQQVEILEEIQCDVCKKVVDWEADEFEAQEFLEVKETYGYGSKHFGDMTMIEIDICEECAYKMLGPFCRMEHLCGWPDVVFKPMEDPEDLDIYQR
jgi:hypothetical protein